MIEILSFESHIADLRNKIEELKTSDESFKNISLEKEIESLSEKYNSSLVKLYKSLTPWQVVQVARHPQRPHTLDYIEGLIKDFIPLAGDRNFADDKAIVAGIGKFENQSVMVIGIEKGRDLESRILYNFGMPKPEGYRKAQRLMKLADKLSLPIITFVDTAGAYPGLEAEERGQGEAIARSIATCLEVKTPLVSVIIGEGGSGGALAIAAADSVLMLQYSVYSVISPEGCASILWKNEQMSEQAAKSLSLTAKDLKKFNIIDEIINEPIGGAHRDKKEAMENTRKCLAKHLKELQKLDPEKRKINKHNKYLKIGLKV